MTITACILGEPALFRGDASVTFSAGRQRQLVASLIAREGIPRPIDALIMDLWGDDAPATARKNVQVLVGHVRRAISEDLGVDGADVLVHGAQGYALDPDRSAFTPSRFAAALAAARERAGSEDWRAVYDGLVEALSYWRGPALDGCGHQDWVLELSRALEDGRRHATLLRARAGIETGAAREHLAGLEAMVRVAADPEVLELLARARYAEGDAEGALDAARRGAATARDANDDELVARLREVERRILEHGPAAASSGPNLPSAPRPAHPIIGRETELAAILDAIANGQRAVSIIGPGGAGKTRIATEVAARFDADGREVAWIDLVPVNAGDVTSLLLTSFGITSAEGDPIDALEQAIAGRDIAMVLDNFEHVLDAAPTIDQLLARCQSLCVIVTTRVPIGVDGEHFVQLGPFELLDDEATHEQLESLDAVRLFLRRADLVDGLVARDLDGLRDIHRVCERVDGLALGIELAAARTRLMPPAEILRQLEATFDLLRSRSRTPGERHHSLTTVIEWSLGLLSEEERRAFTIASMFVGGCTAADFAEVAQIADVDDARALLRRLTSWSLLVGDPDDRCRTLQTVGAHGRRLLAEAEETDAAYRRFGAVMLRHARASNSYTAQQFGLEQRLIDEKPNVVVALEWSLRHEPELAAQLFTALERYLETRGSMLEGDDIARRVLTIVDRRRPDAYALTVGLAARMAHYRGDHERSAALFADATSVSAELPDPTIHHKLLVWRAERIRYSGAHDEALAILDEVRESADNAADHHHAALAVAQAGFIHQDLENIRDANVRYADALARFRALGDRFWMENMIVNLVMHEVFESKDPADLAEVEACVARLEDMGYWPYAAHVRAYWLRACLEISEYEQAAEQADIVLPRVRSTGEQMLLMFAVACAAIAYMETGRIAQARDCAVESLELAIRTKLTMFADYSLVVLALTLSSEQARRVCAEVVDDDLRRGSYVLDARMMSLLDDRFPDARLQSRGGADRPELEHVLDLIHG